MRVSYIEAKNNLGPTIKLSGVGHCDSIRKFIDENYHQNITLSTIAEKFNFNSCYISIMLKKNLGVNFIDYLTRIRIEKAKELLIETDILAFEIAYKVGYQSPQYFSKIFTKTVGMSVTDYKKLIYRDNK